MVVVTHIQSESAVLCLPHGCVDSDLDSIGVCLLHKVILTHDEGQEVDGHDGCAGKFHSLQPSLQLLTRHLILHNIIYRHTQYQV